MSIDHGRGQRGYLNPDVYLWYPSAEAEQHWSFRVQEPCRSVLKNGGPSPILLVLLDQAWAGLVYTCAIAGHTQGVSYWNALRILGITTLCMNAVRLLMVPERRELQTAHSRNTSSNADSIKAE